MAAEQLIPKSIRTCTLSMSKDGTVVFARPLLEVAEDLGLTHEAYYRTLAALQRKGTVDRIGRTVRLIISLSLTSSASS